MEMTSNTPPSDGSSVRNWTRKRPKGVWASVSANVGSWSDAPPVEGQMTKAAIRVAIQTINAAKTPPLNAEGNGLRAIM